MGLVSSSANYQCLMNEVVDNIPHMFCYLEDIIVMTQDLDKHERISHTLMQKLHEHGLVLKNDKCVLAIYSLMFPGHHVTSDSVAPAQVKVQSI